MAASQRLITLRINPGDPLAQARRLRRGNHEAIRRLIAAGDLDAAERILIERHAVYAALEADPPARVAA